MKIVYIEDYNKFNLSNLTIALGYFDGIHIAHKKILNETLRIAKESNTKSAMLTFNESIYDFINHKKSYHLTSFQDKVDILMSMDFDYIIQIEVTNNFINLDYQKFINLFLQNQHHIICGFDYSFGKNGLGNSSILKEKLNNVTVIDCEKINNEKIGTRYIKTLLDNGEIEKANELLDRPYSIKGTLSKRNKFYSLSSLSYYLVKSGVYNCTLKTYDAYINRDLKIKKDENNNLLIIKNELESIEKLFKSSSISIELIIEKEIIF